MNQLWYTISAGTWNVQDLTGVASGPLAWQIVKISGQVLGASGGLAGATVTLTGTIWTSTKTDGSGNYVFWVPAGGSYTVTPSYSGYAFSPASQTFSNITANQTAITTSGQPTVCTTVAPIVHDSGNRQNCL
jgi:hypothetical protein